MRNIIRVFLSNFERLKGNMIAIIIVLGLVLMPSLYAWFSLLAFWNPQANSGNLNVALVNNDTGYESPLLTSTLNAGDQIVAQLRANDQLHWVFVDEDEALEKVRSGDFYSAIVIPQNFSRDLASVFSPHTQAPEIKYYVNEEINPIAPQLTSIGASTLQEEINQTFSKTLADIALKVASNVSEASDSESLVSYAQALSSQVKTASLQLSSDADLATTFSVLLSQTTALMDSARNIFAANSNNTQSVNELADQTQQSLEGASATFDGLSTTIKQAMTDIQDAAQQLRDATSKAFAALGDDPKAVDELIDTMEANIDQFINVIQQLYEKIEPLSPEIARQLQTIIDSLKAMKQDLEEARRAIEEGIGSLAQHEVDIMAAFDRGIQKLSEAQNGYFNALNQEVDKLSKALTSLGSDAKSMSSDIERAADSLEHAGSNIEDALKNVEESLTSSARLMKRSATTLSANSKALDAAIASKDFAQIKKIIGNSSSKLAEILTAPTAINKIPVYAVANFGSALSPFYTSLALYIGTLFVLIILKCELSDKRKQELNNPKPHEEYLGTGLFFLVLCLAQTVLMLTGNLFFLQIQCEHVFLYYLGGVITSFAFLAITYTLAIAFGNVGKALAVILLVLQVAGAGGELPIQLSDPVFMLIYPWLPFTHSMNILGGAIAGIYQTQYVMSVLVLLVYAALFIVFGLVMHEPLMRANKFISKQFEDTGLN